MMGVEYLEGGGVLVDTLRPCLFFPLHAGRLLELLQKIEGCINIIVTGSYNSITCACLLIVCKHVDDGYGVLCARQTTIRRRNTGTTKLVIFHLVFFIADH